MEDSRAWIFIVIVTVTAYKRPHYLKQCLESIAAADLTHVDQIVVSCDAHSQEMHDRMFEVVDEAFGGCGDRWRDDHVVFMRHLKRLGVANHPRYLFNQVVKSLDIVALEEDTIVSPDIFNFAKWALNTGCDFVNLGASAAPDGDNTTAYFDWEMNSPFAWAFKPAFWRIAETYWNGKIRAPYGWDWQITYLCYRENWHAVTPAISRAYNTGREDGTYDTPENWDRDRKDMLICHESPDSISNYKLVSRNRPSKESWPEWVKKEMAL